MNYVKFVIVSGERTGSNLLQMLLDSHTQIICRGELLNMDDEHRRRDFPDYDPTIDTDDDPLTYLQNTLYASVPASIRAVGFRMQYSHARLEPWTKARDTIESDRETRVIHLTRENLLNRYLSYCLAVQSDRWLDTTGAPDADDRKISLNIEDCVRYFTACEWYQDEADTIFSTHPKLDLTYEDLSADADSQMGCLLQFLDVESQPLYSPTKRQRKKTKREVIKNFDELKAWFGRGIKEGWSKQRWMDYFDES